MDRNTFRRLAEIVGEAWELPESERDTFVEDRCGGDEALRAEVLSLLGRASVESIEDLERRIDDQVGVAAAALATGPWELPGKIGPYEVLGVLGEGGMGIVYHARQADPLVREVAVKVIRAGLRTRRGLARFEAERRTLAGLNHPNIAQIFDAGTTVDGSPYFAMEWVDGLPITDYCDDRGLDLDRRLQLFLLVLGGVQHAHQRSITHRDLKPSNVLVTEVDGVPVPKVIDFGIARVTQEDPEDSPTRTAHGGAVGTLEYMSPEQALGSVDHVDTRSDIYSLGVLLYELATGHLPYDRELLRSSTPAELDRLFNSDTPPPPSRRAITSSDRAERSRARGTDPGRLSRRLRGDLDNIVGMAMRADREERYAAIGQFADDIRHFGESRPVSAVAPTWTYRARRFVRRHRAPVVGSVALTLSLAAMSVGFTVRLAVERDRARIEAQKSEQIADFLQGIFQEADPYAQSQGEVTARQLLDAGTARIGGDLIDQPEVRASLLGVAGVSYARLGLQSEAVARLEEAVALGRSSSSAPGPDLGTHLEALGVAQTELGDYDAAEASIRESLVIREEVFGSEHPTTAKSMTWLAGILRTRTDLAGAEEMARRALEIQRRSLTAPHEDLAMTIHTLGYVLRSQGRFEESETLNREALGMRLELHDPSHPDVQSTMGNLASVLDEQGKLTEATNLMAESLRLREEQLGPDHPLLLGSLNNLGYMMQRTGYYATADSLFTRGVAAGRRAFEGDHRVMAILLSNRGFAQRRNGALTESEASHRESLAMNQRLFGDAHPRIATELDHLGRTLLLLEKPAEAVALHRDALQMHTELLGDEHLDRAGSLSALGSALSATGEHAEAIRFLEEAVALETTGLGAENPTTAGTVHELGLALRASGDTPGAEARFREALRIRRRSLTDGHPDIAFTLHQLGGVLLESGEREEAARLLEEAFTIATERLGSDDPETRAIERSLAGAGRSPA